jgi:hypothetical protein
MAKRNANISMSIMLMRKSMIISHFLPTTVGGDQDGSDDSGKALHISAKAWTIAM